MKWFKISSLKWADFLNTVIILLFFCSCQKNNSETQKSDRSGTLFQTGCSGVCSFDLSTGTFNWKRSLGIYGQGGTPFYDSGFLYLAGMYSASAVNAKTGDIKWQLPYYTGLGHYSGDFRARVSPVVVDSMLYSIGFDGPSFNVNLYAIHKDRGDYLWRTQIYTAQERDSISQPKVIRNKIMILKKNGLICLDRISGSVLWQVNFSIPGIVPSFYPQTDNSFIYIYDNLRKRIVAFDVDNGNMSPGSITVPADFDGKAFELRDKYISCLSKSDPPSHSSTYLLIEKETGNIVTPNNSFDNGNYYFFDQNIGRYFFIDMVMDDEKIYVYNPLTISGYEKAGLQKQWETNLPLKKIVDSTGGVGLMISSKLLPTDNSLIQISSYRYINNGTVEDLYCNIDIVDKENGAVLGSLPFLNLQCLGVPYYYMVVKNDKAYYLSLDKP